MRVVRVLMIAAAATALAAAPLFAQERGGEDAKGYLVGVGGFASSLTSATSASAPSLTNTMGSGAIEAGARIAPHVMVFGNIGRLSNLQADLQPTLDATTASLATNQGLAVIGSGKVPAVFFSGGLRVEIPTKSRVMPYVLGGVGVVRLKPTALFSYSSGTMPDGSTPATGTDVTAALVTAGDFTAPSSSTASMFTLGGGAQVLMANHWAADVGYRYSRIAADSTLSASPLSTNGMTFGFGYRF